MTKKKWKEFWEIFYKDDTHECEIRGPSIDDTDFNNKVWEIKQTGCYAHCETPKCDGRSREDMINAVKEQLGYKHVDGLLWGTYLKCKNTDIGKDKV